MTKDDTPREGLLSSLRSLYRSVFYPTPRPDGILSEEAAEMLSDPVKAKALANAVDDFRRGGSGKIELPVDQERVALEEHESVGG